MESHAHLLDDISITPMEEYISRSEMDLDGTFGKLAEGINKTVTKSFDFIGNGFKRFDKGLKNGLYFYHGILTSKPVGDWFDLKYSDINLLIF